MLFNSLGYIFVFLPIALGVYLLLKRGSASFTSKLWLVLASLFFYGSGAISFLLLFLISVFWNYFIGHILLQRKTKSILALGITVDVLALVYFKYSGFLIHNYNLLTHGDIAFVNHLFPLAISFFTFQQIAYLVDCYQNKCAPSSLVDYTLFVSFFPQLIAGPIVHYQEMMPQFAGAKSVPNIDNICKGIFLFSLGLFKKVAIADVFSSWVGPGFGTLTAPSFFDAWAVSLSYTFQIYFDFSGYTDMALGAGLLFNIHLPINFDSPYKSLSIQEFWRRWHITLSRWLRDYLYIPFGGNRHGQARTLANLLLTFIIGGIWHGAGWTFIIWGGLHGLALVAHRLWKQAGLRMHKLPAWLLTFLFVNAAWVFFRAESVDQALRILKGMAFWHGIHLPPQLAGLLHPEQVLTTSAYILAYLLAAFALTLAAPNTMQLIAYPGSTASRRFAFNRNSYASALLAGIAADIGVLLISITTGSEFLYFNF